MFEEGDEEIDTILGKIFSDDEPMRSVSPSHVMDDESTKSGVGTASTLDAVYIGTDGLATDEGRSWELRREGPCQAPSLVVSDVVVAPYLDQLQRLFIRPIRRGSSTRTRTMRSTMGTVSNRLHSHG